MLGYEIRTDNYLYNIVSLLNNLMAIALIKLGVCYMDFFIIYHD